MINKHCKRWLFLTLASVFFLLHNQIALSRVPRRQNQAVKLAAISFYRKYLKHPDFRYKEKSRLEQLLSPRLNTLLDSDLRRRRARERKNPPNYPIVNYLFTCNGDEPPQRVQVSKIKKYRKTFRVTIGFEYIVDGKVLDRCELLTIFTQAKGKWLLDNVKYKTGDDLLTSLSRKFQEPLPE